MLKSIFLFDLKIYIFKYSLSTYTSPHSSGDWYPLASATDWRFHLQQCFPIILRIDFGPFFWGYQLLSLLNKQTIKPFPYLLLTWFHWIIILSSKICNGCFISSLVAIHQKIWRIIKNSGGKRDRRIIPIM